MKKIFNWTFGSVFRTFGRIIAYFLIALLFGFIVSKFDIKITDLLPIMKVNAATLSKSSDQWATQWCNNPACGFAISDATYFRDYTNVNSGAYNNSNNYFLRAMRLRLQFNSSNYLQAGTQYQIRFKLWFNPLYSLNNYGLNNDIIDFTVTDTSNNQVTLTEGYTCSFTAINNTTSFFLTCLYTPSSTLKQVYIRLRFPAEETLDTNNGLVELYRLSSVNYTSSSVTYNTGDKDAIEQQTNIIQEQTDKINDNISELQDALLEDNINDSEVEDALQFDNITENSLGPFTTFLTLPLTWVQNILASGQTCSDINLPLPYMNNKYLTLPCMSGFWSNMGALGVLIQACWLAVVGVRIFNGLFLLTVDTISSKDNEDELTKIKSWEL